MAIAVDRTIVDKFGGEATLTARVSAFVAAITAWRSTTNVPRPTEAPLIEEIAKAGGFTVVEPPPLPPPGPVDPPLTPDQLIDMTNIGALKALAGALFETINDVRVLKGQAPITAAQFRTYLKGKL